LSWELRCATSVARMLQAAGSMAEAHAGLRSVVQRFTEGFDTADLCGALALLAQSA